MKKEDVKKFVRERYAGVAITESGCCGPAESACGCGGSTDTIGRAIGYSDEELSTVPEGANLGLGCGNPTALASLKEGETVLDLGSGAGFDCFLASDKVGPSGKVIGVDMTSEMIDKARENARQGGYENVEFRLGEIEHLPVPDAAADIIISNCVINLSPEKGSVFREAFRVLKPGGRIMVSDIVLLRELPDFIGKSADSWASCVAGAALKGDYLKNIEDAGFDDIEILGEDTVPFDIVANDPTAKAMMKTFGIDDEKAKEIAASVVSMKVGAVKPQVS